MKVAILGNGGFGTAMALALERVGHAVALWGHDPVYTARIAATRQNPRYLESFVLPDAIRVTHDAAAVLDRADVVLLAVPTQHVRGVLGAVAAYLAPDAPVVSLAKGLEQGSGARPSQIAAELLGGPERVFVLSGPSHAEEIARDLPTTVVLAGADDAPLQRLQTALTTPSFRVYRNQDVLGTELCGALKNVMALAAGIADGLGYGDNAKAAILARGLVEMLRFGQGLGADPRTFFGLAGVGDLAVTAFSAHGRNRAFGERIGRGETLAQALAASPKVAEGVWTSRVVVEQAQQRGVEMPIAAAVVRVLYEGLAPRDAVRALMERDPKAEA
ncbi:MAG: NAD(P)-dependent glycerol-3-phosphate dehydrogenase [Planctomycetes bacterium]|nr:NAD(P)-dependent glycerol-3-phosphate dehydrogenase [Planctomycetota bacterium]